jgi:diacylglycerol O-acyltransferase / wax synthase
VTRVDRPSTLDGAFLDLDTPAAPLHVGWTIRLDGQPPTLPALRRHLTTRLDRVPRFRQRLVRTALAGGERRWEDDPAFDIGRHVHACTLPVPGGVGELRAAAGALLSTPLDPARPLWRIYLVTGLAGRGFALVGQAHHVLVDGIAALEVAALLLDAEPEAPADPPSPWSPARTSPARAASRIAWDRTRSVAGAARAFAGAAGRAAIAAGREGGATAEIATAVDAMLRPAAATSLSASTGPRRAVAYAEVGLQAAREAGRRRGATVNDVLLAATTVALGSALRRRDEAPDALKALVPVDVRPPTPMGAPAGLGNLISFLFVTLPVAERDPVRALALVRDQTSAAKRGGHAAPLTSLVRAVDLLPPGGRAVAARLAARLAPFDVTVSNVPGPTAPLWLMGRRVTAIFPAVPILAGRALTIGALSYVGRIGIGLYADAAAIPDVVAIARDLESALDALRVAPSGGRAPIAGAPPTRRG